jgi:hypothetical protein
MEILEAFDLAGTLRGAAELAGCDHKTVAHWVRARDEARYCQELWIEFRGKLQTATDSRVLSLSCVSV